MKTLFNFFKKLVHTQSDFYQENLAFEKAISEGNIVLIKHLYNFENKYLDFPGIGSKVAQNGDIQLFLEVEKLIPQENLEKYYQSVFDWSLARDNMSIIKNMNNRNVCPELSERNFMIIAQNKAEKLLDYYLYDKAYIVSPTLRQNLEKAISVIDMINKRDLLFRLEENLESKSQVKLRKI